MGVSAHVMKIQTNCKQTGMYELGPRTLVVGRNGVGKSGLVCAIELVLTGRCTDIGALPAELLTLVPEGQPLRVEAILSDGRTVTFGVEGSTARAKKPIWQPDGGPFGVLLGREVTQVLSGRPDRLRAALLAVAAAEIDDRVVSAAIPDAFAPEWVRLCTDARAELGTDAVLPDVLIAVSETIRRDLRAVGKAGSNGLRPEAPSDDEIDVLRTAVDVARAGGSSSRYAAAIRVLEAALGVQQFGLDRGDGGRTVCIACEVEHDTEAVVAARDRTLARLARIRTAAPADSGAVRAAEVQLTDALARKALAEEWDRRRADAVREAARADVLRALEGCVRRIVEEALPAAMTGFVERASRALGGGARFAIRLFDKRKPVCRIGLARAGRTIAWRALSGAERARCLAALACAWAPSAVEPVRLVVVDEAWFDAESLAALLDGLGRVVGVNGGPTQAVVCAVEFSGDLPPGWTVVRL